MSEQPRNYFELFELEPLFAVDAGVLDVRYRDLQRAAHPDRFAHGSDQERRISMQQAATINEAYRVLKDPLARARYLLELSGYQFRDEHHTHQDPAFLMEQIELREALGEAADSADPIATLDGLIERIEASIDDLVLQLEQAFAAGEQARERVLDLIQRLQFFRRLEQEASDLEADLEDRMSA